MHSFNLCCSPAGCWCWSACSRACCRLVSACRSCWCSWWPACSWASMARSACPFDNAQLAAWVGNAALAMILLEGGISTRMETFRAGFRPALVLATVGVVLTAAMVGAVAMMAMQLDWRHGLLLGAIVGSTDAAAVFSVLRQVGVRLERTGVGHARTRVGAERPDGRVPGARADRLHQQRCRPRRRGPAAGAPGRLRCGDRACSRAGRWRGCWAGCR